MREDRFKRVEVSGEQRLLDWLSANHARDEAVWLVTYKKAVPGKYVPHERVLDLLVAFGWIDGVRRRVDDERAMQLISPRRVQPWAKSYKDRAERLEHEGRMHAAGRTWVERAKASGMWDAMNEIDALLVPDDLTGALTARPPALEHFTGFRHRPGGTSCAGSRPPGPPRPGTNASS